MVEIKRIYYKHEQIEDKILYFDLTIITTQYTIFAHFENTIHLNQ